MHLVIANSKNLHLINHLNLKNKNFKLVIFGERNSEFHKVCKNTKYIKQVHEIKYHLQNINRITIIDQVSFLDPKCLHKKHDGSFFAANIFGDDELYLMQVMGYAPDELNGIWHDEYINNSNLSNSDIKYEFLERFIYEKNKSKFDFNKYKSLQTRSILSTNSTNKFRQAIKKSKTLSDVISNYKIKFDPFISSKIWYLNYSEENDDISNRLYKYI